MVIGKNCRGLHLYNHMTQRNDIKVNLDYKKVKDINSSFFLKNEDEIVNLNSFKQTIDHLPNKFKDSWVNYLDKNLWLCMVKFTYKEKTYIYYSSSVSQRSALEQLMLKYSESITNLIQ